MYEVIGVIGGSMVILISILPILTSPIANLYTAKKPHLIEFLDPALYSIRPTTEFEVLHLI
jgi:hypothetical protein